MTDHDNHASGRGRGWGTAAAVAGTALAGMAIFNRRRAARAERRHPPMGRFFDIHGVSLHVVEQGSGPEIVLVHGNGTSVADWRASGLIDRLARTHRVIAIDRPGYGYSSRPRTMAWTPAAQAELIAGVLRRLAIRRPIVLGHGYGALVAVELALRDGAVLAGLVLLSGYYYPVRADAALAVPAAIPGIGEVLRHTVSPLMGAATFRGTAKTLFAPAALDERFIEANRDLALRPAQISAEAADAAVTLPAATAMRKGYAALPLPVAIAGGSGDLLVDTERESERLHGQVPGSTFHCIQGAGHMVHWSHQDEVVELVTAPGGAR